HLLLLRKPLHRGLRGRDMSVRITQNPDFHARHDTRTRAKWRIMLLGHGMAVSCFDLYNLRKILIVTCVTAELGNFAVVVGLGRLERSQAIKSSIWVSILLLCVR